MGRYLGRLWKLFTGVVVAFAIVGAFNLMQTGSLGVTWDDAGAVALAALGMVVLALVLALYPGWFDPPET